MADTAFILMQPFCYASGIPNQTNQNDPIDALGESISFGRFASESVGWEKWCAFSDHNRYVEEAERFSRPGSVAQKKAFFEAHYKKLAAQKKAADKLLLQQENNGSSGGALNDVVSQQPPHDDDKKSVVDNNNQNDVVKEQGFKVSISETNNKLEEADPETHNQPYVGNSVKVELQSQLEDGGHTYMHTPILKSSNCNKENLASVRKMKPPVSCKSTDKKKTLHMSNFTPIRELNRLTSSVMRKFEIARIATSSSKPSKDSSSSTPLRTPNMDSSMNDCQNDQKHSSMTPLTGKIRKNMRSPIISSPFSLMTEERTTRGKKKLEEKFNTNNEAQKVQVQLHTRLKEKAETEIRKLRESFCFKARPLPDYYKERKASKEEETNKQY